MAHISKVLPGFSGILGSLVTIVGGALVAPHAASALDLASAARYADALTQTVCSADRSWLACYQEQPSACEEVIASHIRKCVQKVIVPIQPSPEAAAQAQALSDKVAECTHKSFQEQYGAFKKKTPECKNVN